LNADVSPSPIESSGGEACWLALPRCREKTLPQTSDERSGTDQKHLIKGSTGSIFAPAALAIAPH